MLELREIGGDWKVKWSEAFDQIPTATLFHHPDWLEILEETQGLKLAPLGIFDQESMIGMLPLFMKRYGPFNIAASPFVVEDTPYLGPVVPAGHLHAVLRALDHWARQEGVAIVRLLFPPDVSEVMGSDVGYTLVEKHTHIIDLTIGIEGVWKNLKDRCRGAIKKARGSNVEVTFSKTPEEVDGYYQLVTTLFRRQGRRHPNGREFFRRVWERFQPSGNVSLLLARHEGRLVGGVFLGHFRARVYYLDGASSLEGRTLQASNLLLWQGLRWAEEQAYQEFDFVGSDIPRLAHFKESFGGKLHPYWCLEKARGWPVKALRYAYPHLKVLVARLRRSGGA